MIPSQYPEAVEETRDQDQALEYDENLLITREYTHVDSSDENELHRLGYYWPAQIAATPSMK